MKPSPSRQEDLFHLFCEASNGTLSSEGLRILSDRLRGDAEARQRWFEFNDLECGLSELRPLTAEGALGVGIDVDKTMACECGNRVEAVETGLPEAPLGRFGRYLLGVVAVLAVAFGGIGLWGHLQSQQSSGGMASFGRLNGAIWSSPEDVYKAGESVPPRRVLELLAGEVDIQFQSGAVATLYAPCIFEVTSGNGGFLTFGKLKARASKAEAKGFTVQTPTARMVDVGTEFLATASAAGESRVEVLSGEVRVHVPGLNQYRRLLVGDAFAVEPREQRVVVKIENGDGSEKFRLPSIEPPFRAEPSGFSSRKASARVLRPTEERSEAILLSDSARGSILADLGSAVSVTKVNAYSWRRGGLHQNQEDYAVQKFALYGASNEAAPKVDGVLEAQGWDLIAKVDSDNYFGVQDPQNRPEQQASSFTSPSGCLGRYRYLLVVPLDGGLRGESLASNRTFFGEFDVYAEP